jgi:hypothetical protein
MFFVLNAAYAIPGAVLSDTQYTGNSRSSIASAKTSYKKANEKEKQKIQHQKSAKGKKLHA